MTTILLIEDNQLIRETTGVILELAGYAVHTAENGKVGVEKALASKPDLVICDIMMPVLDGYGVLHIFNKNPQLSGVPFIFLSAKRERADFRKGMELGADDYLSKPFDESELLSAIEGRLNRFQNVAPAQPKPDDNPPLDDLHQLLDQARQAGLPGLLVDRKAHAVRKKQYVYGEGDDPTRLFYIQTGQVKTVRTNADGKELITGLYQAGDFFGYIALLENGVYTDSAITVNEAELLYIPKDDFQHLLMANLAVSRQFIRLLTSRVAEHETQLLGMAYNSVRRRVADTLLLLHGQHPDRIIQLSRDDLAALVGTATESVIRILSEFKDYGFVKLIPPNGIQLVHPEKMSQAKW